MTGRTDASQHREHPKTVVAKPESSRNAQSDEVLVPMPIDVAERFAYGWADLYALTPGEIHEALTPIVEAVAAALNARIPLVGETGPEPFTMPPGATVIPGADL